MTQAPYSGAQGGAITPPDPWDPLIRISHWAIAALVILNGLILKPGSTAHVWLGWAATVLLGIRLIWGLIGPTEARFTSFLPSPVAAWHHLMRLFSRERPREYPSHNPAGAMMVYALWACLSVVVVTGLIMTDAKTPLNIAEDRAAVAAGDWSVLVKEGDEGDKSGEGDEKGEDSVAGEIHETAANLMLILALIHVLGVAVESRALGRNLVRPMITRSGRR